VEQTASWVRRTSQARPSPRTWMDAHGGVGSTTRSWRVCAAGVSESVGVSVRGLRSAPKAERKRRRGCQRRPGAPTSGPEGDG
jgi:hypothetical protein